jgi:hypothetical protein
MNKESGEKAQKTQKGGNRGERRLGGGWLATKIVTADGADSR